MFQAQARWLLLAGLSGSLLFACSDDATPETPNPTAGTSSTSGSSGASAQGGSSSGSGGSSSSTAGTMSSSGSGGGTSAGAGGSAAGAGGSAGGGGAGAGGATAGSGGAGGGGAAPTAVANIMNLDGAMMGTATFTQGPTMTKLVLSLTTCPAGPHASHLHEFKICEADKAFSTAGNHWVPNGEGLDDYTCADNKGTLTVEKPITTWTVGDASATDVTKYSFMVHEDSSGPRIGCGLIDKKP